MWSNWNRTTLALLAAVITVAGAKYLFAALPPDLLDLRRQEAAPKPQATEIICVYYVFAHPWAVDATTGEPLFLFDRTPITVGELRFPCPA